MHCIIYFHGVEFRGNQLNASKMASSSIAVSGSPHLVPIQQSKSMVTLKPPVLTCLPLAQTPVTLSCRDLAEKSTVLMVKKIILEIFKF